jgi:hypothetical protein
MQKITCLPLLKSFPITPLVPEILHCLTNNESIFHLYGKEPGPFGTKSACDGIGSAVLSAAAPRSCTRTFPHPLDNLQLPTGSDQQALLKPLLFDNTFRSYPTPHPYIFHFDHGYKNMVFVL